MPLTKLNGININYKVEGRGEPLVMIAGLPATGVAGCPKYLSSRGITG
jgi:hypothetical protein